MRNFKSWFTNLKGRRTNPEKRRSFQGPDAVKEATSPTQSTRAHHTSLPPNFTLTQPLSPLPPTPAKPNLYPIPDEIIAATERGMISENLMCANLPSPFLRRETPRTQGFFETQPETETQPANLRVGSVGSRSSTAQPKHEEENVSPVLTRAEEACVGVDARRSWGSDRARSVRVKGIFL